MADSRRRLRHLQIASVPVAVALGGWLLPTSGAEWSATPRLSLTPEFNTNKRLTTADHDNVFGLIGDVGVLLRRATEINRLEFDPYVRVNRFYGEDNLDSDNFGLRFGAQHSFQRALIGLDASYRRDSTLSTELETTGRVARNLDVDIVEIGPSLTYLVTERDRLDFGYTYSTTTYEKALASGLTDYTYKVADITYTHDITERSKGFVVFSYNEFDGEDDLNPIVDPLNLIDSSSSTDSTSLVGGFQGGTETFSASASGGLLYSTLTSKDILGVEQSNSGVGSLFGFTAQKRFERATWQGAFDRTVQPTGDNRQQNRDQWKTSLNYRLSERLTADLGFRHLETSSQFNDVRSSVNQGDTYLIGDAALRYLLDPYWSVFARYQYTERTSEPFSLTAVANQVQVGVSYSGRKWSVSR